MALTRPTTSPGKASSIGLALLAEHLVGVLRGERLAGRLVGDDHAPLEPAGAHPQERDAVAVRAGPCWPATLNTNPENGASSGRGLPGYVVARRRRGREVDRPRRAAGARRSSSAPSRRTSASDSPSRNSSGSRSAPTPSSSVELVDAPPSTPRPPRPRPARRRRTSSGASVAPRADAGEADELAGPAVDHAAEVAGDARPATSPAWA